MFWVGFWWAVGIDSYKFGVGFGFTVVGWVWGVLVDWFELLCVCLSGGFCVWVCCWVGFAMCCGLLGLGRFGLRCLV